jgi:DedD protein
MPPAVAKTELTVEDDVQNQSEEIVTPTPSRANSEDKFHFIVGCFSNQENANNLVATLQSKGFHAQIVPGGTLIRVSAGSAQNEQELSQLTEKAKSQGLTGWVLK